MTIFILIAILITLKLTPSLSKIVIRCSNFDLSFNYTAYQKENELYLNNKWTKTQLSTFKSKPIKHYDEFALCKLAKQHIAPRKISYEKKTYLSNGYYRFINSEIYVHRWMMEKHLKRRLTAVEVVHHIDGNKKNNNINNLKLFSCQEEHDAYHRECRKRLGTWYGLLPNWQYACAKN